MENRIATLLEAFAKYQEERANFELQAAIGFQQKIAAILSNAESGMGGIQDTDTDSTMGGVQDKGTTGSVEVDMVTTGPKTGVDTLVKSDSGETNGITAKGKTGGHKPKKKGRKSSMVENMVRVMGTEIMSASQVAEALEAAKLAPDSNNLKGYISQVFSSTRDGEGEKVFQTVSRGQYRVSKVARDEYLGESETSTPGTFESPADQILAEQGLTANSFQSAPAFS